MLQIVKQRFKCKPQNNNPKKKAKKKKKKEKVDGFLRNYSEPTTVVKYCFSQRQQYGLQTNKLNNHCGVPMLAQQ